VRLDDSDDGPYRVQVLGGGIVHILPLRHGEEAPVTFEGLLYRFDGSGSPGRNGYCDAGVHDGVPEWQDRQRESLGHRFFILLAHRLVEVGGVIEF
jgi:hypothetical protein